MIRLTQNLYLALNAKLDAYTEMYNQRNFHLIMIMIMIILPSAEVFKITSPTEMQKKTQIPPMC